VSEESTLPQRERSQFLRPADRQKRIARVAAALQERHHPRLALSGILTAAGLAGFLTSFLLPTFGLTSMAARYALAALVAYLAFLGFIRLWVTRYHGDQSADGSLLDLAPDPVSGGGHGFGFGGGGQFSGGGAGRSFETGSDVLDPPSAGSDLDVIDLVPDVDEGVVLLVPIAFIVALLVGLVGVITVLVGAPALLGEVLFDAVIAGAVYRRLRFVPAQHWSHGALRRTWRPMLALGVTLVLAAAIAQHFVPTADSIGDFFRPGPAAVSPN